MGQFRLTSGDYEYSPLSPPEAGFGDYSIWSDAVIESLLVASTGSIARAISFGYIQLAAATDASSIKTDDLSESGKGEADKWLALARFWGDRADSEDAAGAGDWFDLVPVGEACYTRPEASPWPSRWCW